MRLFLLTLLVLAGCSQPPITSSFEDKGPDYEIRPHVLYVVQIDTGLREDVFGGVNIEHTAAHRHTHGTYMAKALSNEVARNGGKGLQAKALACDIILGTCSVLSVRELLAQAIEMRPKVISISLAGDVPDPQEEALIAKAQMEGILVVAAAGNIELEHRPSFSPHESVTTIDFYPEKVPPTSFPAAYGGECMVSVGSLHDGKRADYSRKGEAWVTEVPGETGTSFSTARAAGRAAMYFHAHPEATCQTAKKFLTATK